MPREYEKFEFCNAIGSPGPGQEKDRKCWHNCLATAYDFHEWLQENNFKIVKDGE